MKALLKWILFVIVVVAVFTFAWVVFPGPQIRKVWQVANIPVSDLVGPQGPAGADGVGEKGDKGDTGPAMDPANPAFQAAVDQAVATQVVQVLVSAPASPSAATEPTKVPSVQPINASAPAAPTIACLLDTFPEAQRFGVQLKVDQKPNVDWEFNPNNAVRVPNDSTHPELAKDASLEGCPVVIEGRKALVQEHHIWIILPGDKQYLDPDGIFRAKEFSVYAYPTNWNLEDFSTQKQPISAEFIDAKRNNMQQNGYDWPIFVHLGSGNTLEFKIGDKVGAILPNNCNFADPSHLNVTGVYDSSNKTFDASIGGEGCWTAAKVDGQWKHWQNALDNVQFKTIDAWLMPSGWSEDQVTAWISKQ